MSILSLRRRKNDVHPEPLPFGYTDALHRHMLPREEEQLAAARSDVRVLVGSIREKAKVLRDALVPLEGKESATTAVTLHESLDLVLARVTQSDVPEHVPFVTDALEALICVIRAEYVSVTALHGNLAPIADALREKARELFQLEAHISRLYVHVNAPPVPAVTVTGPKRQTSFRESGKRQDDDTLAAALQDIQQRQEDARKRAREGFDGVRVLREGKTVEDCSLLAVARMVREEALMPSVPDRDSLEPEFSSLKDTLRSRAETKARYMRLAEAQRREENIRALAMHARESLALALMPRMEYFAAAFDRAREILLQRVRKGYDVHAHDQHDLIMEQYRELSLFGNFHMLKKLIEDFVRLLPSDFHDQMEVLDLLIADCDTIIRTEAARLSNLQRTVKGKIRKEELMLDHSADVVASVKYLEGYRRERCIAIQCAMEQRKIVSAARISAQCDAPILALRRWWGRYKERFAASSR